MILRRIILLAAVAALWLSPAATVHAQNRAGTYRGTLHSYCPSFDYTNNVVLTVGQDNSATVHEVAGATQYDSTGAIAVDGSISGLNIRVNSQSRGNLTIPYTATVGADGAVSGSGRSGDIQVDFQAIRVAGAFFSEEEYLDRGVYFLYFSATNHPFGYYAYLGDPRYIYHFDLGYEYVFDAADGLSGVYLYDFASNDYFYTSPSFPFPYLYDFGLQAFLYYYPDPGNPQRYNTNGVRYFYNYATGKIIVK